MTTRATHPADPAPSEASPGRRKRRRVLVLDPSRETAHLVAALLRVHGFEAHVAQSWFALGSEIRTRHPDALVLELDLGGVPGENVAASLRRYYSGPILFLSSAPEDRLRKAASGVLLADFVRKSEHVGALLPLKLNLLIRQATSRAEGS